MSSWSPGMRQDTLPGPSARAYAALGAWLVLLLFACGGVMVVGMLVIDGGYGDHPVTAVAFGGVVVGVIASLVSFALFTRRKQAEARAGYTTVYGPDVDSLPEVDVRSGQVVRLPGEDLPGREHRRRIALVRDAARQAGV